LFSKKKGEEMRNRKKGVGRKMDNKKIMRKEGEAKKKLEKRKKKEEEN